jgi:hypothetical protein
MPFTFAFRALLILAAMLGVHLALPTTILAVDPADFATIVPIDDGNPTTDDRAWAVNSVNSPSCKNYAVFTSHGYQFTSYYGSDGCLNIARRNLQNAPKHWDILRTKFTSYNKRDRHNTSCIAVDGDGYLHVAWGVHNNPLLYTRSTTPVASGQPLHLFGESDGNAGSFHDAIPLQATNRSVTYPEFWLIPNSGDLLLTFRTGSSGRGEYQLVRWDDKSNAWSKVHVAVGTKASGGEQPFIDDKFEGDDKPNVNAYLNDLAFGHDGRLQLTWSWRTGGDGRFGFRDYQTNHNVLYAYSDDQGKTWKNVEGQTYERDGAHDIDEANVVPVIPLPEGSSIVNQSHSTVAPDGTYYLATYWAPLAGEGNHLRQYMLVEFDGKDWKTHQIGLRNPENENMRIAEPELKVFRMSRPLVLVDGDNRMLVIFSDHQRGGGITAAYSESPLRNDWKFIELNHQKMGRWEPRYDPVRWQGDGIVSLYYEPEGIESQLMASGVFEWDARRYFSSASTAKVPLSAKTREATE